MSAFNNNLITEIVFPAHHTITLNGYVFKDNKLVDLDLSQNPIQLQGYGNFEDNQIVNLKLPTTLQKIPNRTFYNNKLTSLKIPASVQEIGAEAFAINKLTSLKIPATLQKIGVKAFYSNELTNIDFSEAHNLYIDAEAFYNNKLTKLNLPTGAGLTYYQDCPSSGWGIFASNPTLTEVTLPQDMTTIPGCFLQGTGIKSVTIPASVTTIGERAFQGAFYLDEDQKLTNLTFAPGSQLTTIGERAFYEQGLITVDFPNTVTRIGKYAFAENKLTKIKLPESNLTVGECF